MEPVIFLFSLSFNFESPGFGFLMPSQSLTLSSRALMSAVVAGRGDGGRERGWGPLVGHSGTHRRGRAGSEIGGRRCPPPCPGPAARRGLGLCAARPAARVLGRRLP